MLASRFRKWPATVLLCAALIGIAATAGLGVPFQTDPAALRPAAENEARQELEQELGFSAHAIVLLVPSTTPRQKLVDGLARLRSEGHIRFSDLPEQGTTAQQEALTVLQPILDRFVPETLRQLTALDFDPEPFQPGLEQFARLFAALAPAAQTMDEHVHDGRSYLKVRCFLPESLHTLARYSDLREAVQTNIQPEVLVVGAMSLMERLRITLLADLEIAASVSGLLCLLLISILLRSVRSALLACVPVAIGFAITIGTAALAGIALNPANFIALPLLLGIGVDDGVHYVARARAGAGNAGEAKNAIWRTTATTALGFGSLCLAQSPGFATLGLLTILGVFACFATTLLVLPLLIRPATSP